MSGMRLMRAPTSDSRSFEMVAKSAFSSTIANWVMALFRAADAPDQSAGWALNIWKLSCCLGSWSQTA